MMQVGDAGTGRPASATIERWRGNHARTCRQDSLCPASPTAAVAAQIAELVKSGLDPAEVAARVLAAIRDNELYVFTHPEMRDAAEERFAAILAAMDKAAAR
jgi:hypothetical protein